MGDRAHDDVPDCHRRFIFFRVCHHLPAAGPRTCPTV